MRIWLAKPDRRDRGAGHYWETQDPTAFYGEWTLEHALYYARTYPDDDRQCIRCEGHAVRQPGEVAC